MRHIGEATALDAEARGALGDAGHNYVGQNYESRFVQQRLLRLLEDARR